MGASLTSTILRLEERAEIYPFRTDLKGGWNLSGDDATKVRGQSMEGIL